MVENPILLHPDYNCSVRHVETAVIENAHLPVDQQDKRYRGACAESAGISLARAHDLGIRSSRPCVQRDFSDESDGSDECHDMIDAFGNGVGFDFDLYGDACGDDVFDY
jgi:hypothetical protein